MSENDMAKIARRVADPLADARAEVQGLLVEHERLTLELIATRARVAKLEEELQRIVRWGEAYPLEVFPEPDLKRAHEVLTAHGMTLDAISAHVMRLVVVGVGEIAREALGEEAT